ncbi:MAG: hypothetical protein FJ104_04275, partial [Deltaproteobacteria bacterium]|nr:hypothetical protein [Deltaproteobacteria bacterium]
MRSRPTVLHALLAAALVDLVAAPAAAQLTTTIGATATVSRLTRRNPRGNSRQPNWVSRQDCLDDDVLTFDVSFQGAFANANLEVWAGGTSCAEVSVRQGTTAQCWLLHRSNPTRTPATVGIRAQDLVAGAVRDSAARAGFEPGDGTVADCSAGNSAPTQLVIDFFFATVGQNGPVSAWSNTGVDVTPPAAPTGVSARSGENRLYVDWTSSTETDIAEYRFFCDPPRGSSSSVVDDAGAPLGTLRQLLEAGVDGGDASTEA